MSWKWLWQNDFAMSQTKVCHICGRTFTWANNNNYYSSHARFEKFPRSKTYCLRSDIFYNIWLLTRCSLKVLSLLCRHNVLKRITSMTVDLPTASFALLSMFHTILLKTPHYFNEQSTGHKSPRRNPRLKRRTTKPRKTSEVVVWREYFEYTVSKSRF